MTVCRSVGVGALVARVRLCVLSFDLFVRTSAAIECARSDRKGLHTEKKRKNRNNND